MARAKTKEDNVVHLAPVPPVVRCCNCRHWEAVADAPIGSCNMSTRWGLSVAMFTTDLTTCSSAEAR